tara:strand:- start:288 stop:401 length:114 start_codon:yes stop_codon:yes gene_type:complete
LEQELEPEQAPELEPEQAQEREQETKAASLMQNLRHY